MPYREKIAWLSLTAMATAFVPYFVIVAITPIHAAALPNLPQLALFAVTAVIQMLILAAGHWYLRRSSLEDAGAPLDERDLAVMRRSVTCAYYVLITGMIIVGVVMPFRSGGWSIINAALFMIIAAEFVHYGVVVVSYRQLT